jgi:hypothetical protein
MVQQEQDRSKIDEDADGGHTFLQPRFLRSTWSRQKKLKTCKLKTFRFRFPLLSCFRGSQRSRTDSGKSHECVCLSVLLIPVVALILLSFSRCGAWKADHREDGS